MILQIIRRSHTSEELRTRKLINDICSPDLQYLIKLHLLVEHSAIIRESLYLDFLLHLKWALESDSFEFHFLV